MFIVHNQDCSGIISLVNDLIIKAIKQGVSDIHLEPMKEQLRVRFRVDGVLIEQKPFEQFLISQIIGRLKVLSSINITHKRMPQDGKFRFDFSHKMVDLRVSTFPTVFGEKVVIRILDPDFHLITLDQLGLSDDIKTSFSDLLRKPQGLFLVTGPTGSGKTTTLYAALNALISPIKNVVTLEDPVEYSLCGVTQSQINPVTGFTFEHGMRSILRQDPDIIMVGEIRDKETAQVAIEAALTGHTVLSTMHTNDASSAVMRLMDMGIEPFLVNATLTGVLAQRLARKLCISCKSTDEEKDHKNINIYEDNRKGCSHCNYTGYKGRIGIFELLCMSHSLRALIVQQPDVVALYDQAVKEGMISLREDGSQKVKQQETSLQEISRILI